jgi:hypothetical protein
MGFNPRADWVHATSPIPKVTLRLGHLKEARDQARGFMIKAQQSWVKHRDMPKYKEGDQVWLEGKNLHVTVSPSPQSKDEENEKLHKLREYACDFRRQHTTDAEQFDWDSDDGDYGLAIGRLVVT